jgi:phosphatidylglycerophosphate synthase
MKSARQDDSCRRTLNLPNLLSALRVGLAPLLVGCAFLGWERLFVALYVVSLLTDSADGFLARRLGQTSKLGARLDSIGDLAICCCLPVCAYRLWPEMIRAELPYVTVGLVCYLAPVVAGIWRYGRMPSFHTWGAKALAVIISAALVVMFTTHQTLFFRLCIPLLVLECMEELAMIAILPSWRPNVPSVWHACRIRNRVATGRMNG